MRKMTGLLDVTGREIRRGDTIRVHAAEFAKMLKQSHWTGSSVGGIPVETIRPVAQVAYCKMCRRWEAQFWTTADTSFDVALAPFKTRRVIRNQQ